MNTISVDGAELHYAIAGDGERAIVLVHGGWTDHTTWRFVVPALAQTHRVVSYDRRGHSLSGGSGVSHGSRQQHEDDLAVVIESLDLGQPCVVGTSYGGSIALALAARRPELVGAVIAHEPPLLGAARPGTELATAIGRVATLTGLVVADLERGKAERGAIRFVEEVALGPGSWYALPEPTRQTMVANALTFVDVVGDPDWASVPAPSHAGPLVLLSDGGASPAWMPAIVDALLATDYDHADHHTFRAAGHSPQLTHPKEFASLVMSFVESVDGAFVR